MTANSKESRALTSPGYLVPFITVTALFFIFGFITTLNMALVPDLRNIFNLSYGWAMLAESAFFLAYFVFSSPSSKLIEWIGYKQTMVVSLFMQVVGCAALHSCGPVSEFPAVSCCGLHRGRRGDGAADFGQSLRSHSRA